MDDTEREMWVLNDEGLYNWWRSTRPRVGMREFLRTNRAELDACINRALNVKPRSN